MIGNLTKEDILNKLQADKGALEWMVKDMCASDAKIRLDSKIEYVLQLIEYIQNEGKV